MEITENKLQHLKLYDIQKFTLENFLNFKTDGTGPVGWAEGIVYWMAQGSDTEFLQKELIENSTLHIFSIDYAEMPEYTDILTNKHNNKTLCVNQSTNSTLVSLTKFLKNRKILLIDQ